MNGMVRMFTVILINIGKALISLGRSLVGFGNSLTQSCDSEKEEKTELLLQKVDGEDSSKITNKNSGKTSDKIKEKKRKTIEPEKDHNYQKEEESKITSSCNEFDGSSKQETECVAKEEMTNKGVDKEEKIKPARKIYFTLPNTKFESFVESSEERTDESKFEGEEKESGTFSFTLIDVNRVKSRTINVAVIMDGGVSKDEAVDFKTIEYGVAKEVERNGRLMWKIEKKAKVKFIK